MTMQLLWQVAGEDLVFVGAPRPPGSGSLLDARELLLPQGGRAKTGPLAVLLGDGIGKLDPTGALVFPGEHIAVLSPSGLAGLGLPPPSPFALVLADSPYTVVDPRFVPEWKLTYRGSRQILSREACVVRRPGGQSYTLSAPVLKAIRAIEEWQRSPPQGKGARLHAWQRIYEGMPAGAVVDGYLTGMRVFAPAAVGIRPLVNQWGEPSFSPALLVSRPAQDDHANLDPEPTWEEVLPQALNESLASQLRGGLEVRSEYALGGNSYVVLHEQLRRVMEVIQQVAAGSPEERRDFLLRPQEVLHARLPNMEVEALEGLFRDDGISERVRELGIWEPMQLPRLDGEEPGAWLPDEDSDQAPSDGTTGADPDEEPETEEVPVGPAKIVLIPGRNLESLDFKAIDVKREGEIGSIPILLTTTLFPHQQEALLWLQRHWTSGSPGALLADDMGLGKTIEALAFLLWVRDLARQRRVSDRPVLIVAPTGLLANWEKEHDRHIQAPGLGRLVRAFGPGLRKLRCLPGVVELHEGQPVLAYDQLKEAEWVLTTYETLRDYQHSFARVQWSVMVLDEAQKVKNPATAMTDAVKAMNAGFQIAMTGTPVENRLSDLWCVVDAVQAGALGTLAEFSAHFEGGEEPQFSAEELSRMVSEEGAHGAPAIMLRRLKVDRLQGLPKITVRPCPIDMPPPQAQAYQAVVEEARLGMSTLEALGRLRTVSLHPRLGGHDQPGWELESARLLGCLQILKEVKSRNEKALVFVDLRAMQEGLVDLLARQFEMAHPPMVINGAIAGSARQARVDVFQERRGFDLMLVSPRAGGVGLTLTAANHVIHLARWWNPAVEDQCTDRVYRIGQGLPVTVHLPMARHPTYGDRSFDFKLNALLERKRDLSRRALAPVGVSVDEQEGLLREVMG